MFRKLRKWYFKIYHLFRFLGIFILIFGIQKNVYAEEYNECYDKFLLGKIEFAGGDNFRTRIKPYLIVESGKTYYVRLFTSEPFCNNNNNPCLMNFLVYGNNEEYLNENTISKTYDKETQVIKIITKENTNIHQIRIQVSKNQNVAVLKNGEMIMSENEEDVLSCKESNEPQENEVYSSFLTLYTDKLSYLANGFTNNPYLLTMIGIILAWVVLELFLHILHLRGGYRK